MKTKLWWIVAAAAATAAAGVTFWLRSGPDASQFAYLAAPRMTRMDPQRMLVVEAVGDPTTVAAGAFKLLFATYFNTDGISKMGKPPAPRGRWTIKPARADWIGRYALPVPPEVTAVPSAKAETGLRVGFETWEYGDVAEILHVGPYSDEPADISRLLTFITSSGFQVVGDHEEEYVRGPGMVFAGDPRKYLTIIRLRVAPSASSPID